MIPQLTIPEIQPRATDWRANIIVLQKGHITTTTDGKRIQKLIFADKEGNKVIGVIWDNMINLLRESLVPFNKYCIGGANVALVKPEYLHQHPGITVQWTITRSTYIRPLKDSEMDISYPDVPFMTRRDMISVVGTNGKIDILAVVIDVKHIKQTSVNGQLTDIQECLIVHQEMAPMPLTLWASFIEMEGTQLLAEKDNFPIILATNLTPSTFSGLSFSTSSTTFMAIEPNTPQAKELRAWTDINLEALKKLTDQPADQPRRHLIPYTTADAITPVTAIIPDRKNEWVEIHMTVHNYQQQLTNTSCPGCKYTITALPDEEYYCFTCKSNQITELKCRLDVQLSDNSGEIKATLFDELAEKLLRHTPIELDKMDHKEINDLLKYTNQHLQGKKIRAQIRALQKKYNDKITRYSILQYHEVTESTAASAEEQHTEKSKDHSLGTPGPSTPTCHTTTPQKHKELHHKEDENPATPAPKTPAKKAKLKET